MLHRAAPRPCFALLLLAAAATGQAAGVRSPDGRTPSPSTSTRTARRATRSSRNGARNHAGRHSSACASSRRRRSTTASASRAPRRASHDETWEQPWGERRFVRDRHNELLRELRVGDRSRAQVQPARARVRRRLRLPLRGAASSRGYGAVNITDELTEFRLDDEASRHHGVVDSRPALEPLRVPVQHARRSTPCTWRTRR